MSHPQPAVLSAAEEPEVWQPHAAEEFQPVDKVGKIAIGLLGASTVTHLLSTWSDWNTYGVVHTYLGGGPNVDDADLNRADSIAKIIAYPNVLVSVAAAVLFVIWLWRARVNSEVLCQADHRRSHGWVLASWFTPGPNFFYPKQIVDDIWVASDPKTPVYADDLRRLRKPLLTKVWWYAWVGALVFDVVIRRVLMWMDATVGSLRGIALAGTASLMLTVVSAAAATFVIRKINAMQASRPWVPWWDQSAPKLAAVPTYADDDTSEQQAISEPIAVAPAPALRLERQPEPALQLAGSGAEEAPKWSPFAPAAASWQDPAPANPNYRPVESWGDDTGTLTSPVEEATPSFQPTAAGLESPSWATSTSYSEPANSDLLSAPLPSWQAESVAPPSLSLVDTSYTSTSYETSEPSWSSSYSEPYSYESSDYLTSSEPIAAPEPEPAPEPVARAGRRAARVAVDSPSTIGYGQDDDYLTPSKPLPTVPSYGPEPSYSPESLSYTPEPAYTPETSYTAYEAPAASYESTSYSTDYSATSYDYSTPETSYTAPETSYSTYDSYSTPATTEPTYDSYTSSYDSTYTQSSYTDYGTENYESYSPNYTPESYTAPDYSTYTPEQPATEYQSPTPYSYEPAEPPAADDSDSTAPRTVPRRRWV